MNLNTSYI